MSEIKLQAEFFQTVWNKYPRFRGLLFHIPNGGKRTKAEAMQLKASGVVAGVPDLFFAYPSGQYHGWFIELKKPGELNKTNDHVKRQKVLQRLYQMQGYKVSIFDDYELLINEFENYIKL